MSPRRTPPVRRRRLAARATVAALGAVAAAVPFAAPAHAAPAYTLEERAVAIASPSLVFVEAHLTGYLRVRATGAPVEDKTVDVTSRCSGFVVGGDGYVVTATHCLQPSPDSLRGSAAYIVANDLIKNKQLDPAQKADYIKNLMSTTDFTGATKDSAPTTTVYGQLFVATGGLTKDAAIAGRVVDAQPIATGDVAVVKLAKSGLPVAQVDSTNLNPDAQVVEVGFGTSDNNTDTPIYTVQSRASKIVGRYGDATPVRYKLDGDVGNTSAGGMVVDTNGHVIGMITADMAAKDRTNQIVTNTSSISQILGSSGVKNSLTPMDQTYRDGLDAYFGGRYSDAIKKFDTVLAAVPNDLVAQVYRKQAKDRMAIEGDGGGKSTTQTWALTIAMGAAAVLVVVGAVTIGVAVRRWRRRAKERQERAAGAFMYPPISGAPTSGVPTSGVPTSGVPTSGVPTSGVPTSGVPTSGVPTSGLPVSGAPSSGAGTAADHRGDYLNQGYPPMPPQFRAGWHPPAQAEPYQPRPSSAPPAGPATAPEDSRTPAPRSPEAGQPEQRDRGGEGWMPPPQAGA